MDVDKRHRNVKHSQGRPGAISYKWLAVAAGCFLTMIVATTVTRFSAASLWTPITTMTIFGTATMLSVPRIFTTTCGR